MSTPTQHLTSFDGGNALSSFRAQALLPRLQAISERITGVSARFVHWVWSDAAQDWAEAVGTINYEIVTRIGPRVERVPA